MNCRLQVTQLGSPQHEVLDPTPLRSARAAPDSPEIPAPSPRVPRSTSKKPAGDSGRPSPKPRIPAESPEKTQGGSEDPSRSGKTPVAGTGMSGRTKRLSMHPQMVTKRRKTRHDPIPAIPEPTTWESLTPDPVTKPDDSQANAQEKAQPSRPDMAKLPFIFRQTNL
jgi:hypothetical protein